MQPQEKAVHYKVKCMTLKIVGANIFIINDKTLFCIVNYHGKFPIMIRVNSLSADNILHMNKLISAEHRLPKKIVSDVGTNFTSKTFKHFFQTDKHPANNYIIILPPKQ